MRNQALRSNVLIALGIVATLTACGGSATSGDASEPAATEGAAPAGETLEVTGVEYEFQGLSDTAPAGTELSFTNGGKEAHELVLMRIKDGETRSADELLALPEKQAEKVAKFQGVSIAGPGEDGKVVEGELTLAEPGRYVALCFIPVGTKELPKGKPEEGKGPGGPPHFTKGMVAEITVE